MGPTMDRDEVTRRLVSRGVLPTAQRVEVGSLLFARPQHLSADQIIARLRANGSRVSKATVYNTLNLFCEKGLVRTVEVDPSRQFYDSSNEAHHHFFNVDTGELTDIPLEAVTLKVAAALPPGTEQAGVDVVIRIRGRDESGVP
jgi:Fur family iron response transcriptional regulator